MSDPRYCARCAAPINPGDAFCAACGQPVTPPAQSGAITRADAKLIAQENQKAKAGGITGAVVWIVLTIVIGAAIQAFWPETSMGLAFGIGAVVALLPAFLVTGAVQR